MKLDLQVRDLTSGTRGPRAFESVEAAKAWLKDRPKMTEVLGIASHHVSPELSNELKALCRPLDPEEKLRVDQLDAEEQAVMRKRAEERQKRELEEAAQQRKQAQNADPNRPMELRYTFNTGLGKADQLDDRPISDEARAAAEAWITERNSWVEGRNQVVGDAKITVHVGELPAGVSERVVSGTFIPVSAPAKK